MGAGGRDLYPWYDGNAGYYDDDGKDLRVKVEDFNTFSQNVRLEMSNFISNWNSAVFPLMKTCSYAFGTKGTFLEAAWTRAHHGGVSDGAGLFLKDLGLGFQAISTAAMTLGIEYQNGDAEGAEGMDAVFNTFYPDSDENSLEKMREAAEQEDQEGQQNTASEPPAESENPYDDNDKDGDGIPDSIDADGGNGSANNPPPDNSPAADDTTVGSGKGETTIPGDPYTDVPEIEKPGG